MRSKFPFGRFVKKMIDRAAVLHKIKEEFNMRKPIKCLLSLAMALSMALCLLPANVSAASVPCYVALGDSITTGYTPDSDAPLANRFTVQLADALEMTLYDDLAQAGQTSEELKTQLLEIAANPGSNLTAAANLKSAQLITITTGGNDLMDALYNYLAVQYEAQHPDVGVTGEQMKNLIIAGDPVMLAFASENIGGFATSEQAASALTAVGENLAAILLGLKQANSTATIIVINQYNPYTYLRNLAEQNKALLEQFGYGAYYDMIVNLHAAFEVGVTALNQSLSAAVNAASEQGVKVFLADAYTAFEESVAEGKNPCNANVSLSGFPLTPTLNLDFHPNADGHTLLCTVLKDNLVKNTFLANTSSLLSLSPNGFESVYVGYSSPGTIEIYFTNPSVFAIDIVDYKLDYDSDQFQFSYSEGSATRVFLPAGGSFCLGSLTPKTGLPAGQYRFHITMKCVIANDELSDYTATLSLNIPFNVQNYTVTVSGGSADQESYAPGDTVTLTADTPAEGMHFASWTLEGVDATGSDETICFTMPEANVTATANFEAHTPEADDGDCTTDVVCSVCGAVATPAYAQHDLVHVDAQAPTQTTVGWEAYDYCTRCGYTTYKELPMLPTYTIIAGDNQTLTANAGEALTVTADGDAAKLEAVQVDGVTVDPANYTVKSGSTIVTLSADFVKTLSAGSHTMTFVYTDGVATAKFTIQETASSSSSASSSSAAASSSAETTLPQTGDNSNAVLWVILLLLAISAMAGTALYISKKNARNKN